MEQNWIEGFCGAVTVCDKEGIILYMNDKAVTTFAKYGGRELIGRNLFDCHPEPARTKLKAMMNERKTNSYTIEKNGVKKLIHQSPWYKNEVYQGFVELSIEIPVEMPHHVRN